MVFVHPASEPTETSVSLVGDRMRWIVCGWLAALADGLAVGAGLVGGLVPQAASASARVGCQAQSQWLPGSYSSAEATMPMS
jgi:hypothetical protein